jgi:transposase
MRIVKQVVGIDVAQKELVVSLGKMDDTWSPQLYARKAFENSKKGFMALVSWTKKLTIQDCAVRYVMEATGVYHEALAYFLAEGGHEVTIVLPNKISNYFKTLKVKTITDKTAADTIATFGLEKKLDLWNKPKPIFKRIRQLTREREQLIQTRTVAKNQLHAEQSEAEPGKKTIERLKKQIQFLTKQEKEIKEELQVLQKTEEHVENSIKLISSIPGIGQLTAATVLAETNGFELVRNKKQLSSYAGYDIREKQSGTSIKGKPRISKKGNKYLRKAMHMPALAAIRYDDRFKAIYARLIAKHGIKMKAVVAIQRKLLEMIYTIYKTAVPYDKSYLTENGIQATIEID